VYALLREPLRETALGAGATDEPLRALDCGGLIAVVGDVVAIPPADGDTLRRHDAVVRRLHGAVDALLPVRFGTALADEQTLAEEIEPRGDELRTALELVAGCYQLTLRVFGVPAPLDAPVVDVAPSAGVGTRYLTARLRAETQARTVPEIAPLREGLGRLVRAERAERHDTPPLLASVYHLVRAVDADAYDAAFDAALPRLTGIRLTRSGPWAPYAFAPERLP